MPVRHARGFTLIELLVALLILTLLAVAGYRGLNAVLQARAAVAQETRKWQQLMFFFSGMEQDMVQALHRPVRDQNGNVQPEWLGLATVAGANEAQLTFTRAGVPDEGAARWVPQRIGYRQQGDSVERLSWPALDLASQTEPKRYAVVSGIREFKLRYLAANGEWALQWPAAGQEGFPAAVEVEMTLTGGEHVVRLFALQ